MGLSDWLLKLTSKGASDEATQETVGKLLSSEEGRGLVKEVLKSEAGRELVKQVAHGAVSAVEKKADREVRKLLAPITERVENYRKKRENEARERAKATAARRETEEIDDELTKLKKRVEAQKAPAK